jgi:hypothetical protein
VIGTNLEPVLLQQLANSLGFLLPFLHGLFPPDQVLRLERLQSFLSPLQSIVAPILMPLELLQAIDIALIETGPCDSVALQAVGNAMEANSELFKVLMSLQEPDFVVSDDDMLSVPRIAWRFVTASDRAILHARTRNEDPGIRGWTDDARKHLGFVPSPEFLSDLALGNR